MKKYLIQKMSLIILFFLIYLIFFTTFILWHLKVEPLINAGLLVFALIVIYFIFDYKTWRKKEDQFNDFVDEFKRLSSSYDEMKDFDHNLKKVVKIWTHQMKVPISAIDLMIQNKDIKTDQVKLQLFQIDNYLSMLLEYIRINNHSTDFRFNKFDLRDVMLSLVRKYSSQFISKNLKVNISGNYLVVSDKRWMSVALEQIINNAVKYTKSGSVDILMDENSIVIKDSGIGILEEDLPRLFDHGFTGYNGRLNTKSTGLGLYLAKSIFEQLGFEIIVNSQVGEGTEVIIKR